MRKVLSLIFLSITFASFGQEIDSTIVTNINGIKETITVDDMTEWMIKNFQTGNYKKAVKCSKAIFDWVSEELGEEHPDYVGAMQDYGTALHHSGDKKGALYYLEKAINHSIKYAGKEHAGYVSSIMNIGMLYKSMGRHDKAINSLEEALEIRNKIAGDELMYWNATR